jgi:hypothetical protein
MMVVKVIVMVGTVGFYWIVKVKKDLFVGAVHLQPTQSKIISEHIQTILVAVNHQSYLRY